MCQGDILKYLIRKRKEVDMVELCKNISVNRSNLSRACKTLRKNGEVKYKTIKQGPFTKYLYSVN